MISTDSIHQVEHRIKNVNSAATGFELFTALKEKNIFSSLFGKCDSESDSETVGSAVCYSDTEDHAIFPNHSPRDDVSGIESDKSFDFPLSGFKVLIKEKRSLGIAHQVWPAATLLCQYLEKNIGNIVPSTAASEVNVLELGAGVGLCSIFLSLLMSKIRPTSKTNIIITDLPEAIEGLNNNISINFKPDQENSKLISEVLCWGNEEQFQTCISNFSSPPVVIAADCIYWTSLFQPFLQTVAAFCNAGSEVIVSHVKRWKKDSIFFAMCRKKGLRVDILLESMDWICDEHTKVAKKQIRRIYKISKP